MDQLALPHLDATTLKPVLQRFFGRPVDSVANWQSSHLSGGGESTTSLYKITGSAFVGDEILPWMLVLKIVQSVPDRDMPDHWNYWRREPLLYESGLLQDLPAPITAPYCFGVETRDDLSKWIWLEALSDVGKIEWTPAICREVARQFGCFNGAYLVGRPLPQLPFVSRNWLRKAVEAYRPMIERLPEWQNDVLVRRLVSDSQVQELARVYDVHEQLLQCVEKLPQSFCHLDAWRWNLSITEDADKGCQIKAIDWAFSGHAPVGQEVAPIVFSHADADMEAQALNGYLEGLHDAGWEGESWQVQMGYMAAMVLQYGFAGVGFLVDMIFNPREREHQIKLFNKPIEDILEIYRRMLVFPLSRVNQATELLKKAN